MAYAPAHTAFPNLRGVARPEYESLPDPEFAEVMARSLGMPAEIAEGWFQDFGRTLMQRAPAILQGAGTGALAGSAAGPYGAIGGAILGGITGGLTGGPAPAAGAPAPPPPRRAPAPPAAYGPPMTAPAVPPPPTSMPAPPPAAPAVPANGGGQYGAAAPAAGPAGAPAAGTVLQLLQNPDLQRALFAVLMGPGVGRTTTEVAGETVGNAAFVNLLREAADQALTQYEAAGGDLEAGEDLPEYLQRDHRRGQDTGNALVRGIILGRLLDQPNYVPVPASQPAATVVYPPTAPAPAPGPGAAEPVPPGVRAAPTVVTAGAGTFEPIPTYGTPDLGIGVPIAYPQEVLGPPLSRETFDESLSQIFEFGETLP